MKSNKSNWFCRLQGNWFGGETGSAGKLVRRGNWFGGETGSAGKLVRRGNWFGGETGSAGKLVRRGNWFGGETGSAGKLVRQGNWFLVTLAKIFIIILVVKQITYNEKVSDITIL